MKYNIGLNHFNPLPEDKIFPLSKLKAFANDNFSVAQTAKFFFNRVENIVVKGEHTGFQHFLLFQQCFQKASFLGSQKPLIVWERVKSTT